MLEELIRRRKVFIDTMPENSIALIFSGKEIRCSADEVYPFKFDNSFYYLTGIRQADTILMICKNSLEIKVKLFIQKFDAIKEVWTGKRLKSSEVKDISGINDVYFIEEFRDKLEKNIEEMNSNTTILLDFESAVNLGDFGEFVSVANLKNQLENQFSKIVVEDCSKTLITMRMVKSDFEIENLRKAIANTDKGLKAILANLKPGKYEYEMANLFKYTISLENNAMLSFNTIAASGSNAVILHYPNPMSQMQNNDLILFDLGADHEGYKADISRTYPINGKFTNEQKEIYEIVLACNKRIINMIKPGLTIAELQKETREFLGNELVKLGLLKDANDINKYYYHNVSHHLGLDTHDISLREMPLQRGNVITVEPGLYIKELGIGIRIEDDVLVTEDGSECLSKEIIKEVNDIELIMNK